MSILFLAMVLMQVPPEPTLYVDGITVSDVDIGDGEMKVTISAVSGKLSLNNTNGLTFISGTGTYDNSMIFTGKINDVSNALTHLKYYGPSLSSITTDIINIEVDDQGNTGVGGAKKATGSIAVTLPTGPIVKVPPALKATEDIVRNIVGISVEATNQSQTLFKVILSADNGTLKLFQTTGLTFIEGDGNNNKSMIFYGSLVDVNAALSIVYYKSDLNFNGLDTVNIVASDYVDVLAKSTTNQVKLTLAAANDSPVLVVPKNVKKI